MEHCSGTMVGNVTVKYATGYFPLFQRSESFRKNYLSKSTYMLYEMRLGFCNRGQVMDNPNYRRNGIRTCKICFPDLNRKNVRKMKAIILIDHCALQQKLKNKIVNYTNNNFYHSLI